MTREIALEAALRNLIEVVEWAAKNKDTIAADSIVVEAAREALETPSTDRIEVPSQDSSATYGVPKQVLGRMLDILRSLTSDIGGEDPADTLARALQYITQTEHQKRAWPRGVIDLSKVEIEVVKGPDGQPFVRAKTIPREKSDGTVEIVQIPEDQRARLSTGGVKLPLKNDDLPIDESCSDPGHASGICPTCATTGVW